MRGPHERSIRERAVMAYERGEGSYETVARVFDIGVATLQRWVGVYRACGRLEPLPKGGGTPSRVTEKELATILDVDPDATAVEVTATYNKRRRGNNRVHVSTIKRALRRFGYVVKKNESGQRSSSVQMWQRSANRFSRR